MASQRPEKVVSVRDLTKVFNETIVAVNEISFDVYEKEIFALLGPNGAGKTTTVEIIEGLQDATEGEVFVFGRNTKKGLRDMRARMGVLPQEFEPFDLLKPPEFLEYFAKLFGRKMTEEDVDDLLELVGLTERKKSLSVHLSGGEKKRLGIALSLVSNPDLIFLDEPTTGLDAQARRHLWSVISSLRDEGKTIFLTTHYLEEAEVLADRVAIMNRGKLIAMGTPEELIEKVGGTSTLILEGVDTDLAGPIQALGFRARARKGRIEIRLRSGETVKDILSTLTLQRIHFKDLRTRRPTLEEAFLKLVGARLEGGELIE